MSSDAGSESEVIWRFQSGPMKHLGASSSGIIAWQKSPLTGTGRLHLLHLHLVAELASGRVLADIASADHGDVSTFLTRALADAATIGGRPTTIVFAREATRADPRLLDIAAHAGITAAFGTQAFKLRQKISRHFEEFLHSQIVAHSSLARVENLISCLPTLVEAWNAAGQSDDEAISRRYAAGYRAVAARLGPDPQREAEREFFQRRLEVREVGVSPGSHPGFHFRDAHGTGFDYLGCDLCLVLAERAFKVPLFAFVPDNPGTGRSRSLRTFNPGSILLRKADVPTELRSAWHRDDRRLDSAINLRDVLGAMVARGVALREAAGALRQLLAVWITSPESPRYSPPQNRADTQPAEPVRAAGVHFANESWERIRERHFWRVRGLWDTGLGPPIVFARVQVESNGRLNVLPEHSLFSHGSGPLNELLRSLFLSAPDSVITPSRRQQIVATLGENATARALRRS